ncbi:hypothetical protein [Streptomyces rochei]|uniref:hypothetical protein n=1 Tax=Streptomyces rochei TaxID=1928 RepID=UPI003700DF93
MSTIDVGEQRFTVTRSAPAHSPTPAPATEPHSASAVTVHTMASSDPIALPDVVTCSGPKVTAGRLDADSFADPEHVLPMVAHWTQDQLYAVANLLLDEGDQRGKAELLELLRWLCEPSSPDNPQRAVKVEFVTQTYENGVFWHDEEIFLHRADGVVEPYEWPEDHHQDDEWKAKDERYQALLADYSRAVPPADGDHLIIDLITGEFDHSGKWSLA